MYCKFKVMQVIFYILLNLFGLCYKLIYICKELMAYAQRQMAPTDYKSIRKSKLWNRVHK